MSVHRSYSIVRADGSVEAIEVDLDVDYLPPSLDDDLSDRIAWPSYRDYPAEEIRKCFNEYVQGELYRLYSPFIGCMDDELSTAILALPANKAGDLHDVVIDKSFEIGQALQRYLMNYGLDYVRQYQEQIEAENKKETG